MSESVEIAVLGGGAAGLFAAIRAAELGRRVVLFERNRRPGVKILMSGGTRCNLTNARGLRSFAAISGPIDTAFDPKHARGSRAIGEAFGKQGARFLTPALRSLDVDATVLFFEQLGVATKIEANGKIFPVSNSAANVLDALLKRLESSGVVLHCHTPVLGLEREGGQFAIRTAGDVYHASRVILAMGGQSYPGCGTTGDGYSIARMLGHSIVDPRPALVPIRVDSPWVAELRGVTVPDTRVTVIDARGETLAERREALLFAHFGLTGPAPLDVSGSVARHDDPGSLRLRVDWRPDHSAGRLEEQLRQDSQLGKSSVAGQLSLPRRLAETLLHTVEIPRDRTGARLSREERIRLVNALKSTELNVVGTLGFEKAEVTTGGIALDEVDPATLESRFCPGLNVIGEVLNLDGPIGGYNFQAAWSSGWLAGEVAAKRVSLET
jgi:predicted Rossmann fold flavoprotein